MARASESKGTERAVPLSRGGPRADAVRQALLNASKKPHPVWHRAWTKIADAWPGAILDDVEVDPAGVFVDRDNRFSGVVNAYVVLSFDAAGRRVESAEALPGSFEGHFEKDVAKIDGVQFDTTVLGVPPR